MFNESTPIEQIHHPDIEGTDVELWIKRDDLIHPDVSGNKWRKLKHYIERAKGKKGIVTFGGAYSNHIAATAAVGCLLGIRTIGIIRGDELNENSNRTLAKAAADGMQLLFVSREEYRYKQDYAYQKQIKEEYGDVIVVPEGGAGFEGMVGASELMTGHDEFDYVALPCGTGATLAGVLLSLKPHQKALGFSALKGDFMRNSINSLIGSYFMDPAIYTEYEDQYEIFNNYHFGGYARYTDELITKIRLFYQQTGIKLDPVYTGKMMFGLLDLVKNKKVFNGKKILAVHTGGLQGISGIEALMGETLFPAD